jgi:hypothetical protein
MSMTLVIIGLATVIAVTVLALALCAAAGWGDEQQEEQSPLAFLGSLRSKTGKPFFASHRQVGELIAEFEGLREGLASDGPPARDARSLPSARERDVVDP